MLISCLLKFTFHGTRCASMQRGWISGCPSGTFEFYFILSQCTLRWACFFWFCLFVCFQNLTAINVTLSTEEMFYEATVDTFPLLIYLPNMANFLVPWISYVISRWTCQDGGEKQFSNFNWHHNYQDQSHFLFHMGRWTYYFCERQEVWSVASLCI